ncbi:MAG: Fic family protein [Bacteriovoracaceae bacterium]|nr:Fic family protein [Bacteriovoracaceae bacterium]
MKSLQKTFIEKIQFTIEQSASLRALGEYRGRQELYYQQIPEVLERMRQVAVIESSESSNRLEGIVAPYERIEAMVLKNSEPKNRSEQEVAGYRDALALIHESYKHMDFTPNITLQLHAMLYRYISEDGGRWKPTDNEITETLPDGTKRIRFKAVSAVQTPMYMDELTKLYKETITVEAREALVIVPLAILDFLCIHPFRDGNGRTGRLLTMLLLYHFDYQVARYISLERVIEESKETYYEALHASSQGWHEGQHNVMPWLNYFWGMLIRAYKEFEDRVGTIKPGRGTKTEQIVQTIERKIGPFAISDIENDCQGIGRDLIRNVIRGLRDDGKIVSTGKGRAAKWIVKKD